MGNNNGGMFRKKAMERISSPEQLTDYLKVTTPGIWFILTAVILLLGGLIAWAAMGRLETKVSAKALVSDGQALLTPAEASSVPLKAGMEVVIANKRYITSNEVEDVYGRSMLSAEVALPDGNYDAQIVTESVHPISFLVESR
ncbi:MAG: hypothetical protein IKO61_05685 [Lachnospiraceae bacterium]|nr:hypothetical protein [Lachnospiraceae bacterium]